MTMVDLTPEPDPTPDPDVHRITYGHSNSATCTCGWRGRGVLADDLDEVVTEHAAEAMSTAMCREAHRGRKPCYSCRDAATRLWLSGVTVTDHNITNPGVTTS
jgi:hypothetical protein